MRRVRQHLTYANVISTLAMFLVLGGGTALAAYVVSSNSQIGPNTVSGHKPPTGKHANLIAGSVNGQDVAANSLTGASINEASLTGDVKRLVYSSAASSSSLKLIAQVGPFKLYGECLPATQDYRQVRIFAGGTNGLADSMWSETENDGTDIGTKSEGLLVDNNSLRQFATAFAFTGNFRRIGGTAMLQSGPTLVQVDFDAVADFRSSPGSCFIYGTATRAT